VWEHTLTIQLVSTALICVSIAVRSIARLIQSYLKLRMLGLLADRALSTRADGQRVAVTFGELVAGIDSQPSPIQAIRLPTPGQSLPTCGRHPVPRGRARSHRD
jgi:hypothetical protein